MDIEFSSNRLERAGTLFSEASRLFGIPVGRKYIQRITVLRATEAFSLLYGLRALKMHPLKGNRTGQYAITLTGNYRLVLEKVEEERVRIVDVENYHGN